MIYPTLSEYVSAIEQAEDNFNTLTNLRPVMGSDGRPFMSSGNFAVVFKMKDEQSGKLYAVKCFTKEQTERAERYQLIAQELEFVSSPYITTVKYLEKELFVDNAANNEQEFPVLLMDWIEGENLDIFLRNHQHDTYALHLLAYQFCRMGQWLMTQCFAHGDIKPDNIIVKTDGSLVLVDYDGMYVPAMKGRQSIELGSPDYRHPLRTADDFNEHIDDFSIASILCSLKALSLDSSLLNSVCTSDRLLFSAADYCEFSKCKAVDCLSNCLSDEEFQKLFGLFLISLSQKELSAVSFRLLSINKPEKKEIEIVSTEVTDEDIKNGVKDEFGVIYSKDGKRLLKALNEIKEYNIKEGTICIGDKAFKDCSSLTSITIPDSVTSIGEYAFLSCKSLTSINVERSNSCYTSVEGILFTKDKTVLIAYPIGLKDTHYTIPDSVTTIGKSAFSCCSSLTSITIPDSVTSIGEWAFLGCSLTSINIPDSVTSIGESAFYRCYFLTSINIPDSVTNIGESAFNGCFFLTSINIPDSVTNIGEWAFLGCSLTSINVERSNSCYTSVEGILFTKDKTVLIAYPKGLKDTHYTIPDSVTNIGESAFSWCESLTSINIPDSVTNIGDGAFYYCQSLTSITIPDSVTSIGKSAFSRCESLTSINIPDSVTSIGESAFEHCYALTSINIPDSVTSIGKSAFDACLSLTSINIPDSVTSIGGGAFIDCKSLTSITIPDSVTSIGGWAFSSCSSLTSINIPDSVTSIGSYAFEYCQSLTSINIPDSVTSIGERAFAGCSSLTSINIPDSVTSIGERAFEDCDSLTSINIPDSVTSIGKSAFYNCGSLTSINIPDSVTSIGSYAFCNCSSLTSINIPDSVTSIGESAFDCCSYLTSINIPIGTLHKFKKLIDSKYQQYLKEE